MPAFRLHVPGQFEDGFLYMGRLIGVGTDGSLFQLYLDPLISELTRGSKAERLAPLYFAYNDLLAQPGAEMLLRDQQVAEAVVGIVDSIDGALVADPEAWEPSLSLDEAFDNGALLDLQIYAQRLFAGTTTGLYSVDLVDDVDELTFSHRRKRTDATCISLSIRYGTVAASCQDAGLLVSFDEFDQLKKGGAPTMLTELSDRSIRSSWLGYHLVNYSTQSEATGLRSRYKQFRPFPGRRDTVIIDMKRDVGLLAGEQEEWHEADFVANMHSSFFVHQTSGKFSFHSRSWRSGRLGGVTSNYDGEMARPLSAHTCMAGMVLERYEDVVLLDDNGIESIHDSAAIVVRTFPSSVRYKNVILVVDEEGLHLISPIRATKNVGRLD